MRKNIIRMITICLCMMIATTSVFATDNNIKPNALSEKQISADFAKLTDINKTDLNTLGKSEAVAFYRSINPELTKGMSDDGLYYWINARKGNFYETLLIPVHEENHALSAGSRFMKRDGKALITWVSDMKTGSVATYKINGKEYKVEMFDPMDTTKMKSVIPANCQGKFTSLYIKPGKYTANIWGVFGMIDEMNAYNNEAKFVYSFLALSEKNNWYPKEKFNYVLRYREMLTEAKAYVLGYMIYEKENNPKEYAKLIGNKDLCTTYTALSKESKDVLDSLYARNDRTGNQLNVCTEQTTNLDELLKSDKYVAMDKEMRSAAK